MKTALVLLATVLAGAAPAAASTAFGEEVVTRGTLTYDHYTVGGSVDVDAEILGDLALAGMRPRVDGRVAGDLLAAGGWLTLAGEVGDDVRAAGGWLELDGRVGDHAAIAGIDVVLGRDADVGGRAWLAGNRVRIEGRVRGPLSITAREVVLAGRIDGPARVVAERLDIRASARIEGDLVYRSPKPAEVAPGASVGGELAFHRTPFGPPGDPHARPRDGGRGIAGVLAWTLALLLPAALLRLALPSLMRGAQRTLRAEPLLSLGIGGLLLIVIPIAALALCLFVVTIPLSLAILLALMPLALAGYLLTAGLLGDAVLERATPARRQSGGLRLAALAAALLVLVAAGSVPYLGAVATLAATLFGTGAMAVATTRQLRPAA